MFVRLCVIQFTRYRLAELPADAVHRAAKLCYHILSNLSRTFSSFFKFFFVIRCPPGFRRSSDNFYIIADLHSFVKNFFQVFSKFFKLCAALPVETVHHATRWVYHTASDLSRTFFTFLQISFRFGIYRAALADSFDILSHGFPFVKHFFTNFAFSF